ERGAYALRVAFREACEAGAVPFSPVLGEGGGEGEMAVKQVRGLPLDRAKPAFGLRLRCIGADLHVEGAGIFLLGRFVGRVPPGKRVAGGRSGRLAGIALG